MNFRSNAPFEPALARGYLLDQDDIPEILMALDEVSSGNLYTSPGVARRLLESLAIGAIEPVRSELKILSDRELEVFSFIGRGFGVTRLARELHLSIKTVETHQRRIKEKLGLRSAAELSEKATRWMVQSIRRNLRLRKEVRPRWGVLPAN
jgi:DNA-binding NarL/FixJ family response regulator